MFEIFKQYLAAKIVLSSEEWELIESVAVRRKVRRRQFLLQEGEA